MLPRLASMALLPLALALPACTFGRVSEPVPTITVTAAAPTPTAAPTASGARRSPSPRPVPSASTRQDFDLGAPVAAHRGTFRNTDYDFAVFPLRRKDNVVVLEGNITAARKGGAVLDNAVLSEREGSSLAGGLVNGFVLRDPATGRGHKPARTAADASSAFCQGRIDYTKDVGTMWRISCLFVDVPETLTTADLEVVNFETFRQVPIRPY